MPIHDVGYRHWSAPLTSLLTRWWVITEAGIKQGLKSSWVRRLLVVAALPAIYFGGIIFAFERYLESAQQESRIIMEDFGQIAGDEQARQMAMEHIATRELQDLGRVFPQLGSLQRIMLEQDFNRARHAAWSFLLLNFFRYPQGTLLVLLLGMLTPPLIARDVRSRAFLLYYARPIGRFQYLLGKLMIPASFVALITTLPGLLLYCLAVMLSPNLSVLADTWDIPLRILVASAVVILPTCSLALMLSSLTQETRFAGFAWFAVWGLGIIAWTVIFTVKTVQMDELANRTTAAEVIEATEEVAPYHSQWSLVSIYTTLGKVQGWVFGVDEGGEFAFPSVIMLTVITIVSLAILYYRISAPLRM